MTRSKSSLFFMLLAAAVVAASLRIPGSTTAAGQTTVTAQLPDSDGDGIPDDWEINGVPITLPNGSAGRWDLKALGASPTHKDVFVWIAWMEKPPNTHKPQANSKLDKSPLWRVVDAFDKADKITNPDGKTGVHLHLRWADAPVIETSQNEILGSINSKGEYDWTDFQKIKDASFPSALAKVRGVFHYMLFAHQIRLPDAVNKNCASGISREIPSFDFIVSLGCIEQDDPKALNQGDPEYQSGTFMHELGHNLGLRHGGGDDINYKPNYVSVMNYLFQFSGVFHDGQQGLFRYSEFDVSLDENHLTPQKGITPDPKSRGYGSAHVCGSQTNPPITIASLGDPIRWDCDSTRKPQTTEITFDTNLDGCLQLLHGQEDWSHIVLSGAGSPSKWTCKPPAGVVLGREQDSRMAGLAPILPVQSVRTSVSTEGVQVRWDLIPLNRVRGYEVFRQGPAGPMRRLTQTRDTSFLDSSAETGVQYSYRVGGVAVLPNAAVLAWLQGKEARVTDFIAGFGRDLGSARFGMTESAAPGQVDLSFRTAPSAPVFATRPAPRQ